MISGALAFVVAAALLVHFILNYTKLGRYSLRHGSNAEAARCSGIQLAKYTVLSTR